MTYRKKVIEEIGAFDPGVLARRGNDRGVQDGTTGTRALLFNSEAYVYHYPRQSLCAVLETDLGLWRDAHPAYPRRHGIRADDHRSGRVGPFVWWCSALALSFRSGLSGLLILDLAAYALADLWITLAKVCGDKTEDRPALVLPGAGSAPELRPGGMGRVVPAEQGPQREITRRALIGTSPSAGFPRACPCRGAGRAAL